MVHAHAYNTFKGTIIRFDRFGNRDAFSDGEVMLSRSITITEECQVQVVATIFSEDRFSVADFELERPLGVGVINQKDKTTTGFGGITASAMFHYASWELLPPGTYTYYLVNRAGHDVGACVAQMKIIAVTPTGFHMNAYSDMVGHDGFNVDLEYDVFADGITILNQAIKITEQCCVQAIGTILSDDVALTDFELEKPLDTIVVDQEHRTLTNQLALLHYSSWKILPPGIYTYHLVNRSGGNRNVYAAQLKIIAVSTLPVQTYTLRIESTPVNVPASLEDSPIGSTPVEAIIEEGEHKVSVPVEVEA